jgi:hypothetical protein
VIVVVLGLPVVEKTDDDDEEEDWNTTLKQMQ